MSLQAGHIYYARKFLAQANRPWDEAAFLVGTVLPDIRYLAKLDRETTHYDGVTVAAVRDESDASRAGFLFHSYLDELRSGHIQKQLGPEFDIEPKAVLSKMVEDQWLYPQISDWPKIVDYFDTVYPIETGLTSAEHVRQWHKVWQRYFEVGPSLEAWSESGHGIGYPAEMINMADKLYPEIAQNTRVHEVLKSFEGYFESRVAEQSGG